MDRVHHIRRQTTIIGSAIATALFLAIAPVNAADETSAPATEPVMLQAQTPAQPGGTAAPTTGAPTDPNATPTDPNAAPTGEAAEPAAEEPPKVEENPYGLTGMLRQGGPITWGLLAVLVLMSFGTWLILFTKYFEQQGLFGQARAARRGLSSASSVEDLAGRLSRSSPFRALVEDGLAAADSVPGGVAAADWIGGALNRTLSSISQRLQGGLPFLATVGSTAPFVGLLGTVMGILQALIKIGVSGQASIDKVAGPVGEALIMTAIGLFVAVPAVFFYNFLVARNKAGLEQLRDFAGDLQSSLIGGRH
ncbi:MAG: MotA/TolQ/ExbB proton channel family protein [Gemmataceae bacterium]